MQISIRFELIFGGPSECYVYVCALLISGTERCHCHSKIVLQSRRGSETWPGQAQIKPQKDDFRERAAEKLTAMKFILVPAINFKHWPAKCAQQRCCEISKLRLCACKCMFCVRLENSLRGICADQHLL